MFLKKAFFILCFIAIFLKGPCFSAHRAHHDKWRDYYGIDQNRGIYTYSGIPGCGCFYHCRCFGHYLPDGYEEECDHLPLEDRIWHEFRNRYLLALKKGPVFPYNDLYIKVLLEAPNPGMVICLPNEYLNAITYIATKLESVKTDNIKGWQNFYNRPKDKERQVEKINNEKARLASAYQILSTIPEVILPLYKQLIANCPHKESFNMVLIYNRGLLSFLEGDFNGSLTDIINFIDLANEQNRQDLLSSEFFQKQGEAYCEVGLYHESIDALNKAIAKNPNNLEAYFQRATSYFETGNFDHALSDYLISKKRKYFTPYVLPENEFIDAFSEAAFQGAGEAINDFVSSLCHTAYGLGECLWTCGQCPVESMQNLAAASYEMGKQVVEYLKTVDQEKLSQYAEEFVQLYENFNQLSNSEKGKLLGHPLGKHGVDFFAGSCVLKAFSAYKQLKAANTICNLEAMIANESTKQAIVSRGLEHGKKRTAFFENTKIHWDSQNKHILGKKNYQEGKSIFEHKDAERLLKEYAGKGAPKRGEFGEPGYREVVDFKEPIGIWKTNRPNVEPLPTTKGTIHYSKRGAHIVPEDPNFKIWKQDE